MDLPALPLSKARNLVDLSCLSHRHLQPVVGHLASGARELDKSLICAHLDKHRHCLVHMPHHVQLTKPLARSSELYARSRVVHMLAAAHLTQHKLQRMRARTS